MFFFGLRYTDWQPADVSCFTRAWSAPMTSRTLLFSLYDTRFRAGLLRAEGRNLGDTLQLGDVLEVAPSEAPNPGTASGRFQVLRIELYGHLTNQLEAAHGGVLTLSILDGVLPPSDGKLRGIGHKPLAELELTKREPGS